MSPLTKVPLRKGAAGTGLQITLEVECALLVRKFDGDVQLPGSVARRVRAAAAVVVGEAGGGVVGEADVWTARIIHAAQNVDNALRRHAGTRCKLADRLWDSGIFAQCRNGPEMLKLLPR